MKKHDLNVGINLGGWISQYPAYDHEHFNSFLTNDDIKRIADWGFDHIRLPVDYPLLEDPEKPGHYRQSGFDYISACFDWCQQVDVRVILDLHKAPGFAFDAQEGNDLFSSSTLQAQYLELWATIAQKFEGYSDDFLAFELLNELVLPKSDPWNSLYPQVIQRIRAYQPQRLVLVGGNHYNDATQMQHLTILEDPNILYTFHFYRPLSVTHQKAPWVAPLAKYDKELPYPMEESGELHEVVTEFARQTGSDGMSVLLSFMQTEVGQRLDKQYLFRFLRQALDFSEQIGQPIYCGEFGVYEKAPTSTRLNWTRDMIDLFNEFEIGRAYWTYKDLDFGLVDRYGNVVNQELLEIVSKRHLP
jgi:aryl-phospho-beta-D-glucosidase BglC (GH1 family)